jgi:hypothetical protein
MIHPKIAAVLTIRVVYTEALGSLSSHHAAPSLTARKPVDGQKRRFTVGSKIQRPCGLAQFGTIQDAVKCHLFASILGLSSLSQKMLQSHYCNGKKRLHPADSVRSPTFGASRWPTSRQRLYHSRRWQWTRLLLAQVCGSRALRALLV